MLFVVVSQKAKQKTRKRPSSNILWMCTGTASTTATTELDSSLDHQPEHFLPYQWRANQNVHTAMHTSASGTPCESPSGHSTADEGEEALPSSLSGMARHFRAQRSARHRQRRQQAADKAARCLHWNSAVNRHSCCPLS